MRALVEELYFDAKDFSIRLSQVLTDCDFKVAQFDIL